MNESSGENRLTRRAAIRTGATIAAGCALETGANAEQPMKDIYQSLGVKPVINAAGTFTALGGSVMPPHR